MGYGYGGTFLVVFLTHPGVIIPTISSAMSLIPAGAIPPEAAAVIPSGGFPPVLSGLWQVLMTYILGAPGNGSEGWAWTVSILYILFLMIYTYYFVVVRLQKGV
jgi:hypothetical protein